MIDKVLCNCSGYTYDDDLELFRMAIVEETVSNDNLKVTTYYCPNCSKETIIYEQTK